MIIKRHDQIPQKMNVATIGFRTAFNYNQKHIHYSTDLKFKHDKVYTNSNRENKWLIYDKTINR